jgi:hypothetical protein
MRLKESDETVIEKESASQKECKEAGIARLFRCEESVANASIAGSAAKDRKRDSEGETKSPRA